MGIHTSPPVARLAVAEAMNTCVFGILSGRGRRHRWSAPQATPTAWKMIETTYAAGTAKSGAPSAAAARPNQIAERASSAWKWLS
jgi:hypothetical protein